MPKYANAKMKMATNTNVKHISVFFLKYTNTKQYQSRQYKNILAPKYINAKKYKCQTYQRQNIQMVNAKQNKCKQATSQHTRT